MSPTFQFVHLERSVSVASDRRKTLHQVAVSVNSYRITFFLNNFLHFYVFFVDILLQTGTFLVLFSFIAFEVWTIKSDPSDLSNFSPKASWAINLLI